MELTLIFADNATGHDDLILRFAGESYVCDSYYLALDSQIVPERGDTGKIRAVLYSLLNQWLTAVMDVPDGGTVYLPYDFSDQYTGWLRCVRTGDQVSVCRGWADIPGYSLSPSAIGQFLEQLPGFRPDGPTVEASLRDLVEAIGNLTGQFAF